MAMRDALRIRTASEGHEILQSRDYHSMIVHINGDQNRPFKKYFQDKLQRNHHLQVGVDQQARAPPGGGPDVMQMKYYYKYGISRTKVIL